MSKQDIEEIVIPTDLKTFLNDIAENRFGYRLGDPWKYSEDALAVVVPILRDNPPERQYITMYEVLHQLDIKDTGGISQVELQNKSGMAIFVRAGTIFGGNTQPRAAQHSAVYTKEQEIIPVRCVSASTAIHGGEKMNFGDIAPPSVTINLMKGSQHDVWGSVSEYTSGANVHSLTSNEPTNEPKYESSSRHYFMSPSGHSARRKGLSTGRPTLRANYLGTIRDADAVDSTGFTSDNLLSHLNKIKGGQSVLDDMMQKVPLFPDQTGAIIFSPVGVIALETFDHTKSWAAIKKEIIEKYGDKIKDTQAEHLFELKPDMIVPMFKKFISKEFTETTIHQDKYSETREVKGEGILGEYTIVKGQPIHVLLLKV